MIERELEKLASTDALTGIANRRSGLEFLERQLSLARRKGYPLTVCFIDVVQDGRLFRLCCKSCIKMLAKSPEEYVAKLDAAVVKEQLPSYPPACSRTSSSRASSRASATSSCSLPRS